MLRRLRALPLLKGALWVAGLWGFVAGVMFNIGAVERAWMIFVGGYQTVLLLAALVIVLRSVGEEIKRGEWNRALALGLGTTMALTALYLAGAFLLSAHLPSGSVPVAEGVTVQRKPEIGVIGPGFMLASMSVGVVLGPGFLAFAPRR